MTATLPHCPGSSRQPTEPEPGGFAWFETAPFRAHLHYLVADTGLHWRILAADADLAPRVVSRVMAGHYPAKLHPVIGRAILAIDANTLTRADQILVNGVTTKALLRSLIQLGCTPASPGTFLTAQDWALIGPGDPHTTLGTELRVRATYDYVVEAGRSTGPRSSTQVTSSTNSTVHSSARQHAGQAVTAPTSQTRGRASTRSAH